MTATFNVIDEGAACEVIIGYRTVTLQAQTGTVYTRDDADRVVAGVLKYLACHDEETDVRIGRRRCFGHEFIVRVDHSPPALRRPSFRVNREQRWIGAGWRMTLVQVYLPRRGES